MILARRKDDWFLAAAAPHIRGCNLSMPAKPKHDSEYFHLWNGIIYVWSHAPLDGITFYPELRYKGMKVCPWNGWQPGTSEPILNVMTGSYYAYPGESRELAEARKRELLAEGWYDGGRDGMAGYVHVDKLEKIEGPPPEGAF